jgi:hypothetical protein
MVFLYYAAQAGLDPRILLLQPEYWDCIHVATMSGPSMFSYCHFSQYFFTGHRPRVVCNLAISEGYKSVSFSTSQGSFSW